MKEANLEKQNYGDSKQIGKKMGGSERFERGRDRRSTEDFQGAETILYYTEMIDICHYPFKTHKMYNTKSEPYYKLQTFDDNELNVGSSVVTNVLVRLLIMVGEAVQVWRQGISGNSLQFLFHFAVNLKIAY